MGRALLITGLLLAALAAGPAAGQSQGLVVRDGSLGDGPPEVGGGTDPLGQPATYLITPEMGEQRGHNLFHSFSSFGVAADETATFTGPDPIEGPQSVSNVISRVSGGDESQIDGTLRSTIPGADLFLINPSGVVFGEGATLDVPGSFHASTGDYLGFGAEGLERFYGDPSRESVLSTAPPGAFGFLGEGPAAAISVEGARLAVPDGETLELVGGDVTLSAAQLDASGETPGTIAIRGGRVVIEEGSRVLAENLGGGEDAGGTIHIAASESVLVDASLLSAGTPGEGDAGTIRLEGGALTLRNGPGLANAYDPSDPLNLPHRVTVGASVETTGGGDAGRLEIAADSLIVTAGAGLSAQTVGPDGSFAGGDGGAIEIRAGSVLVSDLGFATVESWRSTGDAGSIDVHADTLTIDATRADGLGSYPTTLTASSLTRRFVDAGGVLDLGPAYDPADLALGEPGTIEIEARSFHLQNGGSVESNCGDCVTRAGTIVVRADEIIAEGRERRGRFSLIDTSTYGPAARGEGGLIDVTAGSLVLRTGGGLYAGTGLGAANDGGLVRVRADRVELLDGGEIGVISYLGATGDAGSIEIHADSALVLENAGFVNASSFGSGNAGHITIGADSLLIRSTDPTVISAIEAGAFGGSTGGNAGTIDITAHTLTLERGSIVGVITQGPGNAGTITVRADTVRIGPDPGAPPPGRATWLQPAFLTASSITPLGADFRAGNAGVIDVKATTSIFLTDAGDRYFPLLGVLLITAQQASPLSGIFSATVEGGDGGAIRLEAPEITVTHGATVSSTTIGGGKGGTIELHGDRLLVAHGGQVDTSSLPHPIDYLIPGGDAGNVTLDAAEWIELSGSHPHPRADARPSRVSSVSAGSGRAGNVTLLAPRILVDGGAIATAAFPSRPGLEGIAGGNITLVAEEVIVRGGGLIDASTFIPGPGGTIDVTASESILVQGEGSVIESRTGGSERGGDVTLLAPVIEIRQGGEVSARSEPGLGVVGKIFPDRSLTGDPPEVADGEAGRVTLLAGRELLLTGGTIATSAATANGGSIAIEARDLVHLDGGVITATVTGATGGDISIDPDVVILQNGSRIEAQAGTGAGGHIDITADNYFAFPGSVVSATAGNPDLSGTVEVNAPDTDIAGTLTALPASYLDAASLMRERCSARRSGERAGSFAVRGNGGIPAEPDGWLPAAVSFDAGPGRVATSTRAAVLGTPLLAAGDCP